MRNRLTDSLNARALVRKHVRRHGGFSSEETYAYSLEEIAQILSVLPEPAATVFAVAAFTGARRGEIRGLMWENYRDSEIQVTRSIWRGHVTEPKTRRSRAAIPVISPLAMRLESHRVRSGNPKTGVMFPNQRGEPMDLGNLLDRSICPRSTVVPCAGNRKKRVEKHATGWKTSRRITISNATRFFLNGTAGTRHGEV